MFEQQQQSEPVDLTPEAFAEWRRTHPPIAGGAAPDPGPAAGGSESPSTPESSPGGEDPYELANVLNERVPEHLRPYLEPVLGDLRSHLDERVGPLREVHERYAPLNDRLAPLLEPANDEDPDYSILDGLLDFYALTGDESRVDDFMKWWDQVGVAYGFFDEDGDSGQGAAGGTDPDDPIDGNGTGDPRDAQIAALEQTVAELTQRLDGNERDTAVNAEMQRLDDELQTLMGEHRIVDDPEQPEEERASAVILRLARTYESDDAIARGVQDYLRLTGNSQTQMIRQAGEQTLDLSALNGAGAPLVGSGVGAGGGGGQPGASLADGRAPTDPEPVRSWADARRIALERLNAPGAIQ